MQVLEKFLSTHAHFFFCSSPCSGSPRLRTNKSLEGPAHIVCEHCWALGFWAVPLQYFVCSILCLATTERNAKNNVQTSISVHTTDKNSVLAQLSYVHDACRTSRYCSITRTLTCKKRVILITRLVVVRCLYTSDMVRLPI